MSEINTKLPNLGFAESVAGDTSIPSAEESWRDWDQIEERARRPHGRGYTLSAAHRHVRFETKCLSQIEALEGR